MDDLLLTPAEIEAVLSAANDSDPSSALKTALEKLRQTLANYRRFGL
jgi:hypothetical protein